jgi:hypothetical protein
MNSGLGGDLTRDERLLAWSERNGKSERAFYRRLAEMH